MSEPQSRIARGGRRVLKEKSVADIPHRTSHPAEPRGCFEGGDGETRVGQLTRARDVVGLGHQTLMDLTRNDPDIVRRSLCDRFEVRPSELGD